MEENYYDACQNCGELVETPEGILDLDEEGLCEACADALEFGKGIAEEDRRSLDFDYSMNY